MKMTLRVAFKRDPLHCGDGLSEGDLRESEDEVVVDSQQARVASRRHQRYNFRTRRWVGRSLSTTINICRLAPRVDNVNIPFSILRYNKSLN